MQIVETNMLRVLVPDKGYKLINKSTNKMYDKVYLGINDSPDNYIEIIDEEYKTTLQEIANKVDDNQEGNEINIDIMLLSMAKLYELFEPFLAMMPMTLEMEEKVEGINPLVNMYVCIVKRGLMDIDEIPNTFRGEVMKLL